MLYIVYPLMPEGGKVPSIFAGQFEETMKQYQRNAREDMSNDRAFAWSRRISKSIVALGQKLSVGGFPALTADEAVQRWQKYLRRQLERHQSAIKEIEGALRCDVIQRSTERLPTPAEALKEARRMMDLASCKGITPPFRKK